MSTFPDGLYQYGGVPVGGVMSLGIGNVYYVVQSSNDGYADFTNERQGTYHNDSSWRVHATIASALAVTVAERNDYVIVLPDSADYDITAVLTMDKKSVHLVCPAGLGYDIGANNAARVHQETANTGMIALTGQSCEIAGLFFKNAASTAATAAAIYSASAGYCSHIHHNFFAILLSGATNSPMIATGTDGLAWSTIQRNRFCSYTGTSATLAACVLIPGPATGCAVDYNDFTVGDGNTWTAAINNAAVKGSVKFNTFSEAAASGAGDSAGTFTACITAGLGVAVIGNRGGVLTGHLLSGGTANRSFCENFDGETGGSVSVVT